MTNILVMEIWTVYDSPRDFPGRYVARQSFVKTGGITEITNHIVESAKLAEVRKAMRMRGLTCIPRNPADDPVIVECWL